MVDRWVRHEGKRRECWTDGGGRRGLMWVGMMQAIDMIRV
jgi:hypothetical protein